MSSKQTISQIEVVEQSKPKKFKIKKEKKLVLTESTINKEINIKNKGTGAGGSNTNKNGLPYEDFTKLDDRITMIEKNKFSNIIKFNDNESHLLKLNKLIYLNA